MFSKSIFVILISFGLLSCLAFGVFGGNIDPTYKWAWSDNIGWLDFSNVTVDTFALTGYATSSAAGYGIGAVSMSGSTYGVNNDGQGNLSGWAWNENIGWISFCGNASGPSAWDGSKWVCPSSPTYRVAIDGVSGDFSGWAWSSNIGWISFNCLQGGCCGGCGSWKVKTGWSTVATTTGTLISPVYDSQIAGGIAYNTLRWTGAEPANTDVGFQIASSKCSNGADNPPACDNNAGWGGAKTSGSGAFVGYDGTKVTWYRPSRDVWIKIDGPGTSACPGNTDGCQVSCSGACHNNSRYFRYKVELESQLRGVTPRVDDVTLSWSP